MMEAPLFAFAYAGSPAQPAGDDMQLFDLARHLIKNPGQTMFVRVCGDSMTGRQVFDGDILIVDRKAQPRNNDVVIAQTEDGFTVKTFERGDGYLRLVPADPESSEIPVTENTRICGVVQFAIHRLS